jgi:CDP-paratose 2-epimerase
VRILISGICGFAGSTIAKSLAAQGRGYEVSGFDNFIRPGSELNRAELKRLGISVVHGDVRSASDVDALGAADWVIDASANPSVLAGVDGRSSSRQVVEHNLLGTVNLLEYCKRHKAGFILLSTSRVYSIALLASLPMRVVEGAFRPTGKDLPAGIDTKGVTEAFATSAPISLYGATKLASESLALEYGHAFDLPVFINRCGVLAGAGQFGRADQGIFSFWINSHLRKKSLKYIGFGGSGHQVRDCLHPRDLVPLFLDQFAAPPTPSEDRIVNVGGGLASATSLRQLTAWCDDRFGQHEVASDHVARAFDIPWIVLDASKAEKVWKWKPRTTVESILDEIAAHAGTHPDWLDLSAPLG